jgi:hypothetical protein
VNLSIISYGGISNLVDLLVLSDPKRMEMVVKMVEKQEQRNKEKAGSNLIILMKS